MIDKVLCEYTTEGLTRMRIVFCSRPGSAHGVIYKEKYDNQTSTWMRQEKINSCNGSYCQGRRNKEEKDE